MSRTLPSLCDDLCVLLAEAGARSTPEEAVRVIAGTLLALKDEHPRLATTADEWQMILPSPQPTSKPMLRQVGER